MILIIIFIICIIIIFNYIYFNYFYFNLVENFNSNKYTAIIIEPREHKALHFVLDNFIKNLSNEWNFIIFHGNKNINFIQNILESSNILKSNIDRIQLINLNVDNLTIKNYNHLLVSKDFYNYIPTEIFLVFQTDTIICSKNKDLINNFLDYDYVGAPWPDGNVGNGGLSLRRKSKMLEIINNCRYNNNNEDLFFSNSCVNINKPSFEQAKLFSVEAVYNQESFGIHKPWWYLNRNLINEKDNCCDGLKTLIQLNS